MKNPAIELLISFLVFANIGLGGVCAHGAVWETHGRKWSDPAIKNPDGSYLEGYTWDDVCSDWIREKVEVNIFDQYHLKSIPDCGKSANLIHLACAMEFDLPYALNGKREFSNNINMPRFNNITDPQARKRAFMEFINEQPTAGSESIINDTYPVKINRSNVRPGSIALFLDHPPLNDTYTFKSLSPTGFPTFIKGTTDSPVPLYLAQGISSKAIPFRLPTSNIHNQKFPQDRGGIRNWRHYDEARGSYISLIEEKGYDPEEEFSDAFKYFSDDDNQPSTQHTWAQAVQNGLQKYKGDTVEHLDELVSSSCGLMINREQIVDWGENQRCAEWSSKSLADRTCLRFKWLDPKLNDGVFTPKRDANIADRLAELQVFLDNLPEDNQKADYFNRRDAKFADCEISYGNTIGQITNLAQFQEALLPPDGTASKVSSDANDCLDKKWGKGPCEFSVAQNRN